MPTEAVTARRLRRDPPPKTVAERLAVLQEERPPRREKLLPGVHASYAMELEYRRKLLKLIDQMGRSVARWVPAAYRADPPAVALLMAQDEPSSRMLQAVLRRLTRYWERRFDALAQDLGRWFATETLKRSDVALQRALRRGRMSVRFTMSPPMRDAVNASINENVGVIRSIPAQHLSQVEGIVMRSVSTGRDLGQLSDDLQQQLGVAKRRAHLIARDQNNKATAVVTRVRYAELGVTEAIWMHSAGGREPRPTHVKAGREQQRYDIRRGWFDPHEKKYIFPGELINCRCVSRPVLPGF